MMEVERRAIVWDTIERIAFQPSSDRDRGAWLSVYAKTLYALWGMEQMWARFRPDDEFIVTFLNLKCSHFIESVSKYSISFAYDSSDWITWQTHVDPDFISKGSLYSANGRYPRDQRAQLQGDIEAVLDGMIFHPRCHTHLEELGTRHVRLDQEKGGLESHEIRIGGGIENPYVFLFHLRYQFCLVHKDVRQTERRRLIDLFEKSIMEREQNVTARDLFNYRR